MNQQKSGGGSRYGGGNESRALAAAEQALEGRHDGGYDLPQVTSGTGRVYVGVGGGLVVLGPAQARELGARLLASAELAEAYAGRAATAGGS